MRYLKAHLGCGLLNKANGHLQAMLPEHAKNCQVPVGHVFDIGTNKTWLQKYPACTREKNLFFYSRYRWTWPRHAGYFPDMGEEKKKKDLTISRPLFLNPQLPSV